MSYTSQQLHWAKAIIAEVKSYPGLGDADHRARACDIALATAITESNLLMYANSGIPASLKLPHDAVGHDHASVGLFQQQTPMWGLLRDCMDAAQSTAKFLNALTRFDWAAMTNWGAAQRVQVSAFSDGSNYRRHDAEAIALRRQLWSAAPVKAPAKPPAKPAPKPAPKPARRTVLVRSGDTLTAIAARNNVTLVTLEHLNPQIRNFDRIAVGELVYIS